MAMQQTRQEDSTAFNTQIIDRKPDEIQAQTNLSTNMERPSRKQNLMDYATPSANVSAFCRSILSILIPDNFWGEGETQIHNKGLFLKVVDRFIALRRFETVSLHDAVQGMKVSISPLHRT